MPDRPTIYEVARQSGVSTATVSRVMAGGTGFSAATRQRVLTAAADLGWVPSGSARGLATQRAGIVGVVFPDFGADSGVGQASPLYADEIMRGAERAAAARGDAVLIAAGGSRSGRELVRSIAGKVDGLIVIAGSLPAAEITLLARSVPVVELATRVAGAPRLDRIGTDNQGGTRALLTHLLRQHGYRDLAFVGGPARSPDSMERFAEFSAVLAEAGLTAPARPDAIGHFTEAGGAAAAQAILARGPRPEAIVFGNDEMAIGGLGVLHQAGVSVPGDIAITGFDDIAAARYLSPPLTTVRQPMRELGAAAVAALADRIAQPAAPLVNTRLPVQLTVRRSCGCRVSDMHPRTDLREGKAA